MKIIIFIFLWIILATAAYAGISAAPWVPSRKNQRDLLLKNIIIPAGSNVYDLGCGSGTLLFAAAKKQPHAHYIGFEISLLPYLLAKLRSLFYKNVSIKFTNLFSQPLGKADFIFVFLLSKCYPKLIQKFGQELKSTCVIALEAWPLAGVTAQATITQKNVLPLYLYRGEQFVQK